MNLTFFLTAHKKSASLDIKQPISTAKPKIARSISCDSFFKESQEQFELDKSPLTTEKRVSKDNYDDPYSHDWVQVMSNWGRGNFNLEYL